MPNIWTNTMSRHFAGVVAIGLLPWAAVAQTIPDTFYGLRPDMSLSEAVGRMAHVCEGAIGKRMFGADFDQRVCTLSDTAYGFRFTRSSLTAVFQCDRLLWVEVSRTVETGFDAHREIYRSCTPESIDTPGERRIGIRCKQGGMVHVEFPQIGERITVKRHSKAADGVFRNCESRP